MKKIQLVFAALAIMVASAGVFANAFVTIQYFESTNEGADCSTQTQLIPDCESGLNQCFVDVQEGEEQVRYFLSQKESAQAECEEVPKQ